MTRSSRTKPSTPASHPGRPRILNRPHPRSDASRAAPTAAVGMMSRTASASTTRMPMLLGQRRWRPIDSPRRGARNSHAAMAANTAAAAAIRRVISTVGSMLACVKPAYRTWPGGTKATGPGEGIRPGPLVTFLPSTVGDLGGAAARVPAVLAPRIGRAGRLFRRIENGHTMAEHHLAALPAGEQQEAGHHERQNQAPGLDGRAGALAVAQGEVDQRQHHRGTVAEEVLPGIGQLADARITEEVGEAGDGRDGSHDEAGADQPHRGLRPEVVAGTPERQVGSKRPDQEGDRERDQHRVERMLADIDRAHRIGGHDGPPGLWRNTLNSMPNLEFCSRFLQSMRGTAAVAGRPAPL